MTHAYTSTSQDRSVRVFVSSTFCDMQLERDYLIKFVFPQLRKRCRARGVEFTEVDLRWGVTEEQAERGEVLPICLAEIERCHPYFVGILGERYGYVPNEIPKDLVDAHPWLIEHREYSITELEILHGVLNNPKMNTRGFFYFLDPARWEVIPTERRVVFETETPEAQEKLARLKDRICGSGQKVREGYSNPEALGEAVLEDLWSAIDWEFPESSSPDPLEQLSLGQQSLAESLARIYIGRQEYFDKLDNYVENGGSPIVVVSDPGGGKSALLATWGLRYQDQFPQDRVFLHFVGSSPESANCEALIGRLLGNLRRWYGIEEEVPLNPKQIRKAFPDWLARVPNNGQKLVIILDGLNSLDDQDAALTFDWLPEPSQSNVRLIISTRPGPCLTILECRRWFSFRLEELSCSEREEVIREYLSHYGKSLSEARIQELTSVYHTSNPLFLRTVLNELRIFGVHEKLQEHQNHLLAANSLQELYERILERWERDYNRNQPGLVEEVMSLIWASRNGLTETEIMQLVGTTSVPLPRVFWSPLYLAVEQEMQSRSGFLNFANNHLRQAVKDKYVQTSHSKRKLHLKLASFFSEQEISNRMAQEFPWQLIHVEDWEHLRDAMSNLDLIRVLASCNAGDILRNWLTLEEKGYSSKEAFCYLIDLESNEIVATELYLVSIILKSCGHLETAIEFLDVIMNKGASESDYRAIVAALFNKARLQLELNKKEEAYITICNAEEVCYNIGIPDLMTECDAVKADIVREAGDKAEADELTGLVAGSFAERGDHERHVESLIKLAASQFEEGDSTEALQVLCKAEAICIEKGNQLSLAACLNMSALVHAKLEHKTDALDAFERAEKILECLELPDKLAYCLQHHGLLLFRMHDFKGALELWKKEEMLQPESGSICYKADAVYRQGLAYFLKSEYVDAECSFTRAASMFAEEKNIRGVIICGIAHSNTLIKLGKARQGMRVASSAWKLTIATEDKELCQKLIREINFRDAIWRIVTSPISRLWRWIRIGKR